MRCKLKFSWEESASECHLRVSHRGKISGESVMWVRKLSWGRHQTWGVCDGTWGHKLCLVEHELHPHVTYLYLHIYTAVPVVIMSPTLVLSNICLAFMYQLAHAPLCEGGPRVSCVTEAAAACSGPPMYMCAILQILEQQPIAGATERVTGAGVGAPGGAPVSHQVVRGDTWSLPMTETSLPLDKFSINGLELGC